MSKNKTTNDAGWNFDNSYSRLPEFFFSIINPTPVRSPALVILNHPLAKTLGLNGDGLQSESGVQELAGNRLPEGATPLAMAYAGHQFGSFTMLGDGRAVLLGEQITAQAERFDIQLKGSGQTPYSRRGDGRAALGPMLREYVISEAMHALGIPTSRSLAVVTTGEKVYRETELPGAVLARVAASHLRVGTFEYVAEWGTIEDLRMLADYTLRRHFPFPEANNPENRYLYLLQKVVRRQAGTIAKWQLAGFIHGVMNTDNMALSGETIDYGPCAFMDAYNPATVFSSIDVTGRYAYQNQPGIAQWNLARFAEAILPLLHGDTDEAVKLATDSIADFKPLFHRSWLAGMRAKLGIVGEEPQDEVLINELLSMMEKYKEDYTNTFCALTYGTRSNSGMLVSSAFEQWREGWQARLKRQPGGPSQKLMQSHNPVVIPRNFQVEKALSAAVEHGDTIILNRLLQVLSDPFHNSDDKLEYTGLPEPSGEPYRTFCGT